MNFAPVAFIFLSAPVATLAVKAIAEQTGIEQSFLGAALLAVTTSLPELVASIASLRIGAYDMAVGNLFGSNVANMSVLLFADAAYTEGPILAAVGQREVEAVTGRLATVVHIDDSVVIEIVLREAVNRRARVGRQFQLAVG